MEKRKEFFTKKNYFSINSNYLLKQHFLINKITLCLELYCNNVRKEKTKSESMISCIDSCVAKSLNNLNSLKEYLGKERLDLLEKDEFSELPISLSILNNDLYEVLLELQKSNYCQFYREKKEALSTLLVNIAENINVEDA